MSAVLVYERLRVASGAAALVVLTFFAKGLTDALPGPDVAVAGIMSIAVATSMVGAGLPFAWLLRREVAKHAERPPFGALESLVFTIMVSLGSFASWGALALTNSLFALPLLLIAATGFGMFGSQAIGAGEPSDDEALERRLTRFALEVGVEELDVHITARTERSTYRIAPTVVVVGRRVSVPRDLADASYAVLEFRLARAIVMSKRRETLLTLLYMFASSLAFVTVITRFFEGDLLKMIGVTDWRSPAVIPLVLFMIHFNTYAFRPITSPLARWTQRRDITRVLDLTRDPDGALESIAYDERLGRPSASEGWFSRYLYGKLSRREQSEVIERWRADRRIALLFTDVVESTAYIGEHGDNAWDDALFEHDRAIRACVAEFGGEEIDKSGDGFLITFTEAGRAVLAAEAMQRRIAALEVDHRAPLHVRMGIHAGDVIRRGRELVGREVHLAARIGAAARAAEILVSSAVHEELHESGRFRFGAPRAEVLKGFPGEHEVYPVVAG